MESTTIDNQSKVRRASPSDVDWIIPELRKFSEFYGTKKPLFGSEEYVRQALPFIIENHFCLVAEIKNKPVGLIMGFVQPHPFNPEIKVLAETIWWVEESHRHSKAAHLLFNAFVAWGKENCDWVTFGLTVKTRIHEATLLTKGFKLRERNYLLEVA